MLAKGERLRMPYKEYLQTPHWQNTRKAMMGLKLYRKCELCGTREYKLHVHHLNYDCLFEEKYIDLVVLCSVCHKKVHDEGITLKRDDNATRLYYFSRLFYYLKGGREFWEAVRLAHTDVDEVDLGWGGYVSLNEIMEVVEQDRKASKENCIIIRS